MRNNLPFNAIISLFSEKRCYNPVTEWNNFDFWRKWQAAVSEKTKKRRPKSPFFEKDCKRQPIRRFLGMRIVRRMASSVSSRRDSAPMPASRTSRRPRSRLLRNRRTSLRRKTRRPEGGRGLQLGQTLVDVLLRLGYVQVLADDVVEGVETFFFILQTEEGTGMTLGQVMFCEQAAAVRGEPQQAQLIGRSGPAGRRLPPAWSRIDGDRRRWRWLPPDNAGPGAGYFR